MKRTHSVDVSERSGKDKRGRPSRSPLIWSDPSLCLPHTGKAAMLVWQRLRDRGYGLHHVEGVCPGCLPTHAEGVCLGCLPVELMRMHVLPYLHTAPYAALTYIDQSQMVWVGGRYVSLPVLLYESYTEGSFPSKITHVTAFPFDAHVADIDNAERMQTAVKRLSSSEDLFVYILFDSGAAHQADQARTSVRYSELLASGFPTHRTWPCIQMVLFDQRIVRLVAKHIRFDVSRSELGGGTVDDFVRTRILGLVARLQFAALYPLLDTAFTRKLKT